MSNSIEKLAKEAERLAENLQGNPFPAFDRIAKDIRERQDNAMAMEFTKCIGELLRKNGITPKIKQYGCDFYGENSFSSKYGVIVDELDFSEHDKVFEDKIAELENIINNKLGGWDKRGITYQEIMDMKAENQELKQITKGYEDKIAELKKDYKTASELLGKYQQENESLKKRVVELENFSCQAEQETESLVEKLNQRIVKLEKSRSEWIDKTVEWQQKCEKLESKETEIVSGIDTSNSLACAKSLIEHMTHCEKFMIMPERDVQTFSVEELKEIADYLMVYYKHHKDRDAETISF